MTSRPSKKRLWSLIHKTEEIYRRCWSVLRMFRPGPGHNYKFSAVDFFEFQPILCEALLDLDREYRIIEQEKKRLIAGKNSASQSWFRSRMMLLERYQTTIVEAIRIGKIFGDSFAWSFYKEERGYLLEHLKQPGQRHLPPGIGGIGEREFIRNIKEIRKKILIYHGTTTFLRIGDLSLIDLKTLKLVSLCELKTIGVAPGKLQIRLSLIGPKTQAPLSPDQFRQTNEVPTINLFQSQQNRIERQLKRMQDVVINEQNKHVDGNISLEAKQYASELTSLVRTARIDKFAYKQCGDGLLLGAYRSPKRTIYSRLQSSDSKVFHQKLNELDSHALHIVKQDSKHNSAYVGSLFYSGNDGPHFLLGAIPLFWWPIDPDIIKLIIFQEVLIFSMYNPAHLFDKLEQRGFEIVKKTPYSFSLRKRIGNSTCEFVNFQYFMHLIQHELLPEDIVLNMVDASEDKLIETVRKSGSNSIRMDLSFIQRMGHKPTE